MCRRVTVLSDFLSINLIFVWGRNRQQVLYLYLYLVSVCDRVEISYLSVSVPGYL